MKFSFNFKVDSVNGLLICDVQGEASQIVDVEHMMKHVVKIAGKNQVKCVVLDVTEFTTSCSNIDIAKLMMRMEKDGWLGDLKIARIINPENNVHPVIGDMAVSLSLAIKNFESRSQAMIWLLFDNAE
jgi:hypothetical protein